MIWLVSWSVGLGQPSAPSSLAAGAVSTAQINLTWKDNSTNELGFRVEQSLDSIVFSEIALTSANVTNRAAINLSPAIKYYFRVRAYNGSGNSAYSNPNSATTFTPWAQWQLANFTTAQLDNAAVSGLTADPDGDSVANFAEYGFNRQPLVPDNANTAFAGIQTIVANKYLALVYQRNASAIDIAFGAKVSSNLLVWDSGTNVATGPIPVSTNGGILTAQFRATRPVASVPVQFMQLTAAYNGVPDSWVTGPSLPATMTEMSCAWLGDNLYVTGFSDGWNPAATSPMFVFNILSNTWSFLNPDRPLKGNHHAVEVFGGRIYLIGGFDANSSGKVQIYDPATNGWSFGASAPFAAGSCASALINGKIYIAGGITGVISGSNNGYPTNAAAVYDIASNVWTSLPPMPFTAGNGMNHAAAATDGNKVYIFGGRDNNHAPANGDTSVQIYDPASNTWVSSTDPGSSLAPLPQARGGMGKAVYYNGDFYVMGGEAGPTGTGATPDDVYNRVDIYNVVSNTWRSGTPMPTARHGIFPVLRGNRIYVVGGGQIAGPFYSSVFEIYIAP